MFVEKRNKGGKLRYGMSAVHRYYHHETRQMGRNIKAAEKGGKGIKVGS